VTTPPTTPRPAAALTLLRDRDGFVEVFMVQRHSKSTFMPDVFVFPGGAVANSDRSLELTPGACAAAPPGPTELGSGFRIAAIRECFEEAGVLLARNTTCLDLLDASRVEKLAHYRAALQNRDADLTRLVRAEELELATDLLLHWAHWITPETLPVRFDTQFFIAQMPESQTAAHDRLETTDCVWITPESAISRYERGEFPLVIATLQQLQGLTGLVRASDAFDRYADARVRTVRPRLISQDGVDEVVLDQDP
jgi:8-oxo-dGTP pyrophosphatase MutT (NUDIX family)